MTAAQPAASTAEEAASSVSLKGVSRRFGEAYAVKRVDLELPQGEFFALLGPSGCGKTTTLRMVGGFELPTAGRIHLAGKDVTMLPPHKRDVNTVFQSYALFPHLTVIENVAFGLRRNGISKSEALRRADEHLELVGLAGFDKRRPTQLSGGQQQRVALARALVNHPKVLLLDEPMGALDAKIRKSMQLELKRIQREVGITFLYVTHDQAEAMSMADRLAVMNAGLIEDVGVPQRVYDRPATQFVAEFLGTCNVLPVATDDGVRLPDGGIVDATGYEAPVGEPGWKVGIRPEKLELSPIGAAARLGMPSGPNRTTATVSEVTYLGASTEARLETPWGTVLQAYKQNIGDGSTAIHPGDLVEVSWHASQCFLLPPSPVAATATDEEVAA